MLLAEQEQDLVNFLAVIYCRIPWGKFRTKKNPHDVFNHRVKAAARRATLYEFASRLCNFFGLQSMPVEGQRLLDALRPYETKVLNTISSESVPLCVRAIILGKEIKAAKKAAAKEINKTNDKEEE